MMCVLKKMVKTRKISGYMYEFQDLPPISGHFRTNFKISGQRPGLRGPKCIWQLGSTWIQKERWELHSSQLWNPAYATDPQTRTSENTAVSHMTTTTMTTELFTGTVSYCTENLFRLFRPNRLRKTKKLRDTRKPN